MCKLKMYCLTCERPNICKCKNKHDSKIIYYSDKLRPPLTTSNKFVFRKFLDDCPQFVNLVPQELRFDFLEFLRKIKYFGKSINGQEWTNIKK